MRSVTKNRDNAGQTGNAVRATIVAFNKLYQRLRAVALSTSGLAIKGAGLTLAKSATAFRFLVPPSDGLTAAPKLGLVAANTDAAAYVGTVTHNAFNVFVHTVSMTAAGVQTHHTRMGTEGASRAAVVLPAIPDGEAAYGITEINPTGAGNFVGGTTALDDAGVVPNAVFVSLVGAIGVLSAADLVGGETGTVITQ